MGHIYFVTKCRQMIPELYGDYSPVKRSFTDSSIMYTDRTTPSKYTSHSHQQRAVTGSKQPEFDQPNCYRRSSAIVGDVGRRNSSKALQLKQFPGYNLKAAYRRNHSLEPHSLYVEPVLTYSVESNTRERLMRRRRRRRAQKCRRRERIFKASQDRFPSPSHVVTTLDLLRQLPFARLHYNSFRRLFPVIPTRCKVEKLPPGVTATTMYCKDDQMFCDSSCLDSSPKDTSTQYTVKKYHHTEIGDEKTANDRVHLIDLDEEKINHRSSDLDNESTSNDDSMTHDEMITQGPCNRTLTPLVESRHEANQERSPELVNEPADFISVFDERSIMNVPYIDTDQEDQISADMAIPAVFDRREEQTCIENSQMPESGDSRSETPETASLAELASPSPPPCVRRDVQLDILGEEPQCEEYRKSGHDSTKSTALTTVEVKGQSMLCSACRKPAYPAESFDAAGQFFHMLCFRCKQCSTSLHRGAWNQHDSAFYCNPCHRKIALQTLRHS